MASMEPLRTYEYLCLARGKVLDATRALDAAGYARTFPIGLGSLARTLTHILMCEWYYVERMQRREVPPYERWQFRDEEPPGLAELEEEWGRQAERTRAAIRGVRDWGERIEYRGDDDATRPMVYAPSAGDIFTQLVLHEVHHRAQAMNMLRHLGVTLGDLDYNALMYERRPG